MTTQVEIEGNRFYINGKPTYEGVSWQGYPVEGLLMNSRMVQAVFDDENPATARTWRYPDTGLWEPDRNTDEFCAALPEYRRYGLLAVTVGLQGGGSVFTEQIYHHYVNSAFTPEGELKPAYFLRMERVLRAADQAGIVVIVNYLYWRQATRFTSEAAVIRAVEGATHWLLASGYRNILLDIVNEANTWPAGSELLAPEHVHRLLEVTHGITLNSRRLLAAVSTIGRRSPHPAGRRSRIFTCRTVTGWMPHNWQPSSAT